MSFTLIFVIVFFIFYIHQIGLELRQKIRAFFSLRWTCSFTPSCFFFFCGLCQSGFAWLQFKIILIYLMLDLDEASQIVLYVKQAVYFPFKAFFFWLAAPHMQQIWKCGWSLCTWDDLIRDIPSLLCHTNPRVVKAEFGRSDACAVICNANIFHCNIA